MLKILNKGTRSTKNNNNTSILIKKGNTLNKNNQKIYKSCVQGREWQWTWNRGESVCDWRGEDIVEKKNSKAISSKKKEKIDIFQILLTDNYFINPNSIHICFPTKIKKKINQALDTNPITINICFAHFVKEISVTKYGSDKN